MMLWCVWLGLVVLSGAVSVHHDKPIVNLAPSNSLTNLLEMRGSLRHEDPLEASLADRASLLFRALDKDSDRHISAQDVRESEARLFTHMPGISISEFSSFIDIADLDGDGKLSRDELFQGLADGVKEIALLPPEALQHPSATAAVTAVKSNAALLETDAQRRRERGIASKFAKGALNVAAEAVGGGGLGGLAKGALDVAGAVGAGGLVKGALDVAGKAMQSMASRVTGAVDTSQDGCVMCQYIVERCEANVKQSGVIPALTHPSAFDSYLELESRLDPRFASSALDGTPGLSPVRQNGAGTMGLHGMPPLSPDVERMVEADAAGEADESLVTNTVAYAVNSMDDITAMPQLDSISAETDYASLLETDARTQTSTQNQQLFYDHTAAGIIGATRQTTRVQRQLERQKYNEIYRVVDISLDDVCEQGMPNAFYGFCKQIYKLQTDVVDGLRYQYRPADICFRVGMCGKASYITKGIHTRYK